MKTIASVAIAGMLAASTIAVSASDADAGGKRWRGPAQHHHHHYYHRDRSRGFNSGAALATGAILGLAIGAMATPTYAAPPPPAYQPAPPRGYVYGDDGYAQHVSWCSDRYRSYRADTNTWLGYDGYVRECVSPYMGAG